MRAAARAGSGSATSPVARSARGSTRAREAMDTSPRSLGSTRRPFGPPMPRSIGARGRTESSSGLPRSRGVPPERSRAGRDARSERFVQRFGPRAAASWTTSAGRCGGARRGGEAKRMRRRRRSSIPAGPPHGHERGRPCPLCREGILALRALRMAANIGLRSRIWERPSAAILGLILVASEVPRLVLRDRSLRRRGRLLRFSRPARARRGRRSRERSRRGNGPNRPPPSDGREPGR